MTAGESVLVTGVGGGVGQSIIKALAGSGFAMVGVDADGRAAGLQAVPVAYRVPRADDPAYVPTLVELCAREQCRLIFPGLDPELPVLAAAATRFTEVGVTVVVSDPKVIRVGDDKFETAAFLSSCGFPAPETVLYSDDVSPSWLPVVLKPRWGGSRSVGVFVAKTIEQFRAAQRVIDPVNCVVQEYLAGDEYTCGTVNFDGQCYGPIVMRRELRNGDTYRAEVIRNDTIEAHVSTVAEALQPFGACNFQLRLRAGEPVIFEINPRCSGTTAARALAGFNEPLIIADYLLRKRSPEYSISQITILRYWAELVASVERIGELATGQRSAGKAWQL
jgi:carbamoyl-phosphate synthase large subunit